MPPTQKGRNTEAAFLEAARRVFAEKGYLNAKISDIAQAAGKSSGSFYNYYENKEELLRAMLEEYSAEMMEESFKVQRKGDLHENIRASVAVYWNTYRKYLAEMVGMFQMSMTDEVFADQWKSLRATGIRTLLIGLRAAEQSGYRVGPRLDLVASALMSSFEGFCWAWLAAGGEKNMPAPTDDEAIETLTTLWLRTVYSDRSGLN